jgi:CheY-like chemotaxis protein
MDKKRVLIVDDVPSNIHLLMDMLKDKYSIVAATNGKKALEIISDSSIDIVLLDISMPQMDGYEVLKKIKSDEKSVNIPVIFVSSFEEESQLKIKADGFISKPFSKQKVLDIVSKYLNEDKNYIENRNIEVTMEDIKKTILVVDDSPENLQVMIEVLKQDYKVTVATSAKKALELLDSGLKVDLILLDVIMPEMDGYELCKELKSINKYKDIPVIFVTILENEHDIVLGFELGAVDYVIKPIEPIVLKARINTHLKLKSYQDKLLDDIKQKDELLLNQSKLAVLGEMFENITHQWKQPLSSISVSTTGIKIEKEHDILTDERLMSFMESIELSVKHLNQTIDDFKNFLVNDTKQHRFNLKDIINKTIKLLQIKFKTENILIQTDLQDVEMINYQNDLIQVLMNILSNAYEALWHKSGKKIIEIETYKLNNQVCIEVRDNAGGIANENLKNIFKKYFSTKEDKEGSGVGLYMTKKILDDRLKGEIDVYNIDDGACFKITLPSL